MKKFSLIISLIFSTISIGQNCKYERNEIDDFTKKKILETKEKTLAAEFSGWIESSGLKIDENRYIKMKVHLQSVFGISAGSKITLLDENGQTYELTIENSKISSYVSKHFQISELIILSNEMYKTLINAKIKKVRVQTTDGYIDMDSKPKYWDSILQILKCIE